VHAADIAADHLVRDLGQGKVLLGEPLAQRIGVVKLPPNAPTRIVLRLEFGGEGVKIWSCRTGAHPVQNMGRCEIGFDQVFLLPARLAGRGKISG
jgi:hypothetical protein